MRHLVLATAAWQGRVILAITQPFAIGQAGFSAEDDSLDKPAGHLYDLLARRPYDLPAVPYDSPSTCMT